MSAKRRQEAIARFSVPIEDPVTLSMQVPPSDKDDHVGVDSDSATESDSDFAPDGVDEQTDTDLPKPKGKGKGKANSASDEPTVMLISLKAVLEIHYFSIFD